MSSYNTNASAIKATFNLSKVNDNLRKVLLVCHRVPYHQAHGWCRWISGRIQVAIERKERKLHWTITKMHCPLTSARWGTRSSWRDCWSYTELGTMAADVSKNTVHIENYSEFLELQDQLNPDEASKVQRRRVVCRRGRMGSDARGNKDNSLLTRITEEMKEPVQ